MFKNIFKNKKVLITGHTGFKGSWLTTWLLDLEANIVGVSKDIPTNPSMFVSLNLEDRISHNIFNITNIKKLNELIKKEKPDFIFHLAAQAIVSKSYENSIETINSNVIGTVSILEVLKDVDWEINCIFVTSDKSYLNVEWPWGYKETDTLGGKDIYSGSKAAAEILIKTYFNSFLKFKKNIKIAVGRAGNVIGGGDWAKDRIVVDTMIAWSQGEKVELRSPYSTRPWQHVLEPLSGYLLLASKIFNSELNGEAFNFGPNNTESNTVINLIENLENGWPDTKIKNYKISSNTIKFDEAKLLKLNCDKALHYLKWYPSLTYDQTHKFVSEWYFKFYKTETDMLELTINQIKIYVENAKKNNLRWAKE